MARRGQQNPFLDMIFGGQTWYNQGGGNMATATPGANPNSVNRTPTRVAQPTPTRNINSINRNPNAVSDIRNVTGGGSGILSPNAANPNIGLDTSGLDFDLEQFTQAINDAINSGNTFNIGQRNDAINLLTGPNGFQQQVNAMYDPLISETQTALPLNPFSDKFRGDLLNRANDLITTQGQGNFDAASGMVASRGLSAGGTTSQTAAGGIISDMLNSRIGAETGTAQAQLDFNTQANFQRQSLLDAITGHKTNASGALETLAAQIQAGNVIDPMASANVLGNAVTTQLSREDRDDMLEWIKQQEPTIQDKLWGLLPLLGTAMFPSAQNLQAMLGSIFGQGGVFGSTGNYNNPFGNMQPSGFNVFGS